MVGGGWKAIRSVLHYSARIGPVKLWQTLRSKNACKACAFGTGGQNGGLFNEARQGIEICNKNIQAHLSDVRPGIPPNVFFQKSVAELGELSGKQLEDLGRLTTPLYKGPGDHHYRPTDYAEVLQICTERLRRTAPDRSFFYASGRSSNEAAFLLQLLARLYGTNNVNNCSYYCHQASGVALADTLGTGTATVEYADIGKADLIFVFGANPASNHPRFVKTLIRLRRRGGQVVVVNPAKEPGLVRFASPGDWRSMLRGGVPIASEYVQPHLGGDLAFIQGVAKAVLAQGGQAQAFIDRHTTGYAEFAAAVDGLNWRELELAAGVDRATMERIAALYVRANHCIFSWSMGLTHHLHGVDTLQALVGLALLRGMVGKPGAGLLPLRGHSNIQGTGSMGFTPELKHAIAAKLEAELGQVLPRQRGLDTMACMHAAARGEMDAAILLGGNLLAATPDTRFASAALNKIPFKCFFSTTLNLSHVQGVDQEVVILPVRARDEERQRTTQESMFNFVRLSDGGFDRFAQLRSEVELICHLGEQLIAPQLFDFSVFRSHARIRRMIGDVVPGFGELGRIDTTLEEFHIEGRILHTPVFPTADGKARFVFHAPPARPGDGFLLTSVRSEGQFNSIIYHAFDSYRNQRDRWVVLMNPQDMRERGWRAGQTVDLSTEAGVMRNVRVQPFDIRRGNLMTYYPEANALIGNRVDPRSRTPGFKSVPVTVKVAN